MSEMNVSKRQQATDLDTGMVAATDGAAHDCAALGDSGDGAVDSTRDAGDDRGGVFP